VRRLVSAFGIWERRRCTRAVASHHPRFPKRRRVAALHIWPKISYMKLTQRSVDCTLMARRKQDQRTSLSWRHTAMAADAKGCLARSGHAPFQRRVFSVQKIPKFEPRMQKRPRNPRIRGIFGTIHEGTPSELVSSPTGALTTHHSHLTHSPKGGDAMKRSGDQESRGGGTRKDACCGLGPNYDTFLAPRRKVPQCSTTASRSAPNVGKTRIGAQNPRISCGR